VITKNAAQLKTLVKKKADEKDISAQLIMQHYMLERLLERISASPYKTNFIVKGGFLISAIVGIGKRATRDLDTTVKGFDLTHETAREIFEAVSKIQIEDGIAFEILGTADIRKGDSYPGIRVSLKANYPPISVPLTVDVTTGDKITPCEIEYTFMSIFNKQKISIMAYTLETTLSEKLETVITKGTINSRPRDYYDIYILWKLRDDEVRFDVLRKALEQTSKKRGSYKAIQTYGTVLSNVLESERMQMFWKKYQAEFNYANDITFEMAVGAAREIMEKLASEKSEE